MAIGYGVPCPKPPKREKKAPTRIKRKVKPRAERDHVSETRHYVFGRERDTCRACRCRLAESMHEIIPRGRGGKVSRRNSIAVCGQLGNGPECHGQLQRADIRVQGIGDERPDAERALRFFPQNQKSADWMRIPCGDCLESHPMREMEAAE